MSANVGLDSSALDPNFKEHAQRGIGRYVTELVSYFQRVAPKDPEVTFFDHREFRAGKMVDGLIDLSPVGRETIRQQVVYPLKLGRGAFQRYDVLHFPAHMDAPSWSIPPYIITVLDLIPVVCRELYEADRPGWRFHLARWLELRAIKNAALVLAISESTAADVERLLGVPRERIVITPLGVDSRFFASHSAAPSGIDLRVSLGLPTSDDLILYVGGIDQRKNWNGMLESLRELRDRRRSRHASLPVLVMAGRIDRDRQYPLLLRRIQELQLEDAVISLGYVSEADLIGLYRECKVYFFPSLYEGFGLTPLEALAAGAAVVSSNTSAMPEVLGDAALLVNPTSIEECARTMDRLLDDSDLQRDLRERGPRHAARYTWERTGETTLAAYRFFLESTQRNGKRVA